MYTEHQLQLHFTYDIALVHLVTLSDSERQEHHM
jgi:hypothetical protein